MATEDEKKCVFVATVLEDGTPMLMIGIPRAAWDEHLRDGRTMEFDMRKAGMQFAVSIFGGETRETILAEIRKGAEAGGVEVREDMRKDYTIPKTRKH